MQAGSALGAGRVSRLQVGEFRRWRDQVLISLDVDDNDAAHRCGLVEDMLQLGLSLGRQSGRSQAFGQSSDVDATDVDGSLSESISKTISITQEITYQRRETEGRHCLRDPRNTPTNQSQIPGCDVCRHFGRKEKPRFSDCRILRPIQVSAIVAPGFNIDLPPTFLTYYSMRFAQRYLCSNSS